MERKHLRYYHATQARPVFTAELPKARERRNWRLLVILPLALLGGLGASLLALGWLL